MVEEWGEGMLGLLANQTAPDQNSVLIKHKTASPPLPAGWYVDKSGDMQKELLQWSSLYFSIDDRVQCILALMIITIFGTHSRLVLAPSSWNLAVSAWLLQRSQKDSTSSHSPELFLWLTLTKSTNSKKDDSC